MNNNNRNVNRFNNIPWKPRIPIFTNKANMTFNFMNAANKTGEKKVPRLSRDHEDMLIKVFKKPHVHLTPLYKELGLSGYMGGKIKQELIREGLVAEVELPTNRRGRKKKLLQILPKGRELLKQIGISGGPKGRGGVKHQHYQAKLKEWYERRGHAVEIEAKVGNSSLDLLVIRKDGQRLGIEIALSEQYELENARKGIGLEYLMFVCETKELLDKLRRKITAVLGDQYDTKLAFKLVEEFNLED